jgi:hypothetical protein
MREHLTAPLEPPPWPGPQNHDPASRDFEDLAGDEAGCPAAVSEITTAIGDTRWLILVSGALLAADVAGEALATAELLGRRDSVALGLVCLLVPVMLSWLVATALLLAAERPVTSALGELRRVTGAPVDLAAPWRPIGVRRLTAAELDWSHVVPLIGAAATRHGRARQALFASVITTAGLLGWLLLSLAISAVA